MNEVVIYNNCYVQYEIFLCAMFLLMPVSRKITELIDTGIVKRKLNQYTNWNILMIFNNYILINCFGIYNINICKFIAHNSLQVMLLFHIFIIYDSRILFEVIDENPIVLKYNFNNRISKKYLLQLEYIICNIVIHILPVYFYRDTLIYYSSHGDNNMYLYAIIFKFMWALNIFGNFNICSIYVPTIDFNVISFINIILVSDYLVDKTLMNISY